MWYLRLGAPVTRVGSTPLPDALDVGGTCEVIAVAWLLSPAVWARGVARLPTRGLGAGALACGATRVGSKEGLTMLTLTLTQWTSHGPASPQAHEPWSGAWKEENGEAKSVLKKSEEHGRRG